MARARNIKPGFFLNDELAEVAPLGRLLFAGLWTVADREGRLEDRAKKIRAEVLPYDDCDVEALLSELAARGFIIRYMVGSEKYIQIVNFSKHQNPHKNEKESEIPPYDESVHKKYSTSTVQVQEKSDTSTVQEQKQHTTNRADSLKLIPDSFNMNPDSLIPDSLNPESSVECADAHSPTRAREEGEPVDSSVDNCVDKLWKKRFKEFWEAYPRKTGKGAAEKAYEKISPSKELHETMIRAVRSASLSRQWTEENGRFIPKPATWLNQKRWEDELPVDNGYSKQAAVCDRAIAMLETIEEGSG